ncbi:hypothetical protein D3C71_2134590 [compost metagenome]
MDRIFRGIDRVEPVIELRLSQTPLEVIPSQTQLRTCGRARRLVRPSAARLDLGDPDVVG